MVGAIVRASLTYRVPVLAGAILLALLGLIAGTRLDIDVLPDISRPTLVVMTEAPGLSAEDVETLVTRPLELALTGLPSTLRLRSTSATGLAIVTVELDWGADIVAGRQQAAERLGSVRDQLPAGVTPQIQPVSSIMGEILLVAMSGDRDVSPMDLRGLADWTVRPRLAGIPGISQVTVIGGEIKQVRVAPDPALMAGLDISVSDIERAIAQYGAPAGGGFIDQSESEFVIRLIAPGLDTLGGAVVAVRKGVPILLRQVARIGVTAKPARGSAGVDGQDGVILSVQKQPGADTRALTATVIAALGDLQATMPAGVRVDRVIFKQADFIDVALGNVGRALLESSIVVAIVLLLFFGTVRATAISLIAIPLSLLSAILVFRMFGLTINTMTLGGFAIAVGELVDDAIVDVENVFRRLKENAARPQPRPAIAVVAAASQEVRSGILYATVIIMLVLAPLFVLSGIEGRLFRPLALAYVVAMAVSLVTAMTITPVLCLWLARTTAREAPVAAWLKARLDRWLPSALAHPRPVIAVAALAVGLAALALVWAPRSLMPPFNEGSLTVELTSPPGITLADSSRLGRIAETLLLTLPDVASVGRRTGRAELDEHAQGLQTTEIDVALHPAARPRADIVRDIRQQLAVLPVSLNIGQPISHRIDHLLSGVKAGLVIKVFGDDLDADNAIAAALRADLSNIAGLTDLQVERQARVPAIAIHADPQRALLHGVSPNVLVGVLALANGRAMSQVVEGARRTELTLRLDDRDRTSAGLGHLLVETPTGRVPVANLGDVLETDGRNQIERENGRRRIAVSANLDSDDAARTVYAVRAVMAGVPLPPGASLTLEGAFIGQEQAARRVALVGALALLGIFALLMARYRSPTLATIVMINIPLSLVGGVAALAVAGLPLSLASMVGFVTLAGISVRNGILKVSHYLNLALFDGASFGDALVLRGSRERLVPVLMTALAAAFALAPLLRGAEPAGKEILYPVAVVVFGGLISATVLDTVLTPVLFHLFGRKPLARLLVRRTRSEAGAL